MKINEFRVDEGFSQSSTPGISNFIGALNRHMGGNGEPDSAMVARVNAGAYKNFVQNFVSTTRDSLDAAIAGNMLDMNATASQPASTGPRQKTAQKPVAPGSSKTSFGKFGAAPGTTAPAKPSNMSQGLNKNAARTTALNNYDAARGGSPQNNGAKPKYSLKERQKYNKLNTLFEHLIEASSDVDTISSYVIRAFQQYMKPRDITPIFSKVQQLANEVQQTYSKDKGTAALTKLGQLGYAEAMAARQSQQPAQQPSQQQPSQQAQQQPQQQPAQQAPVDAHSVIDYVNSLKKNSPEYYTIINAISRK